MSSLATEKSNAPSVTERLRAALGRVWHVLRGGRSSPRKLALSTALGLFVGCLPVYGLHFPICLGLCLLLRLDLLVAYLAANVSNPVVAPFLVAAELEVGSFILRGESVHFDAERLRELGVQGVATQLVVGSVVVGALLAVIGGALVFLLASRRARPSSELELARERTLSRYREERIVDRKYVEGKLLYDPVLECIAELGIDLGAVVDAGAGRGQLGLCLLELGRVRTLFGFDLDERRIDIARRAAGDDASFAVMDLSYAEIPQCDTVLLVDVLHYLEAEKQDGLLERAARALEPGGRLLIRDTDGANRSGVLTRAAERCARVLGWHRGNQALTFRPLAEVTARLHALGLDCRKLDASQGTPFSNQLVIAETRRADGVSRAGT